MYSPWQSSWIGGAVAAAVALLWQIVAIAAISSYARVPSGGMFEAGSALIAIFVSIFGASVVALSIRLGLWLSGCNKLSVRASLAIPGIFLPIFVILASLSFSIVLLTMPFLPAFVALGVATFVKRRSSAA
jgi:hypothetical protein